MAENKKSFVLYVDLIHTVESLKDNEAGRLLKHILRYVNDLNPKTPDKITGIVFEPIKQQMKRDLIKWEDIKISKSDSGKLGNLKRWNNDLYLKVINNEINLSTASQIAHTRKVSHTDSATSQSIANIAVNDNVIVNVNDIVIKENIINKTHEEIFEKKIKHNPASFRTQIGIDFWDINPSEHLKQNFKMFFERQVMSVKLDLSEVLVKFDNEYSYIPFKDTNHFQNAFKAHLKKIIDEKNGNFTKLNFNGTKRLQSVGTGAAKDFNDGHTIGT